MKQMTKTFRAGALMGLISAGGALPALAQTGEPGGAAVQPAATRGQVLSQAEERAVQIVLDASRSEDARERAAAIEAAGAVPDRALPMAQLALGDENAGVRFAALVTIGKLQLRGLGPAALELANDDNDSVRGAAVFAAQRCGEDVPPRQLSYLAQMLGSQDIATRGNAAMLLGMLAEPSAIPMLQEMARTPMPRADAADRIWLHLQFAEAILKLDLNNETMLDILRSSVYSNIDDVRVLALRIVGEVGDRGMTRWMEALVDGEEPVQIRIAAARSLAQMGNASGREQLIRGGRYSAQDVLAEAQAYLRANRGNPSREADLMQLLVNDAPTRAAVAADIRAQAAFGLGELDDAESARVLVGLMDDAHPIVKLASAAAVLQAQAD